MSTLQIDFFSKSLMRTVTVNAIVPVDKIAMPGQPVRENKPYKALYLLHGFMGDHTDWIVQTRVHLWAQERNLVVIMPAGENKFYVDNPKTGEMFSEFIGEELVEITRKLLPISDKREDTYIAGLSMGGYGACINGLRWHDTFGYVGMFSSGFILENIPTDNASPFPTGRRDFYTATFGNIDEILGSNMDYKSLAKNLKDSGADIPKLFMVCGEQDFLIESNRDYNKFLTDNGIDVYYEEWEGVHDWKFWDESIIKFMNWLPLEEIESAFHSGNVTAE